MDCIRIVQLDRDTFVKLCEIIPPECSFSSFEHIGPNRVLWARWPGVEPTQIVFIAKEG